MPLWVAARLDVLLTCRPSFRAGISLQYVAHAAGLFRAVGK